MLLILLVIYGHFHNLYVPIWGIGGIYAFHVPAFLWLTGLVLPQRFSGHSLGQLWQRRLGVLLWAYAVFSLLSVVLWWGETLWSVGEWQSPWRALWGVVYGVQGAEFLFVHHNGPLWYFPFLITTLVVVWALGHLPPRARWGVALAYAALPFGMQALSPDAGIGAALWSQRWPWCLEIAGIGAVVMMLGQASRGALPVFARFCDRGWGAWGMFCLAAAALFLLARWNAPVNLNRAELGQNGVISLINMMLGAGLVAVVAAKLPLPVWADRWVAGLARQLMVIFAIHIYLVRAVAWVLERMVPAQDIPLWGAHLLLLGASCLVLALSAGLARACAPWLQPVWSLASATRSFRP